MTERKPAGMGFPSWIDEQIAEAERRGVFGSLPGEGKPIPRRPQGGGEAWLQDYLRREGVSAEEMLPTPLRLRKEIERLSEAVPNLRSEDQVRDIVGNLNRRILQWRRNSMGGPPVFVPLVRQDEMVARWKAARAARAAQAARPPVRASVAPSAAPPAGGPRPPGPRRWWRRLRHRA